MVDHVADHEHLGITRQGEIGVDADPAGAVQRGPGLLGERLGQRAGLHPGRPHLGHRLDPLHPVVAVLDLEAALVDVGDHGAEHHLHAELLELAVGPASELGPERREHLPGGVDQQHPGGAGVDGPEVALEGAVGQLGDLAGHLHPGGAGADDDEGEQVVDVLTAQRPQLGHLEGPEDPAAQLQRVVDALHAGRELGELVVAEVGLPRAGGHDQRVVGHGGLAAEDLGGDRPVAEVDVGDRAQQDLRVLLAAEDLAGRRGDLALGEDPGRDLVEQRLEEVVGGLGHHGHLDVAATQLLGAEEPAEAGADDDHPVSPVDGRGLVVARRCVVLGHPGSSVLGHSVRCRVGFFRLRPAGTQSSGPADPSLGEPS